MTNDDVLNDIKENSFKVLVKVTNFSCSDRPILIFFITDTVTDYL